MQFADWLKANSGESVDPDTIFDCQIKRIHEYKRQLLNALRIVVLYNRLRENPNTRDAAADVFLRRQGGARPIISPNSSSSSSTIWQTRSMAILRCADGSRCYSCPSTTSRSPSG